MYSVAALIGLFLSFSAGAVAPDCNQRLIDLQDAKLAIEDRFNIGEVTRTDVALGVLTYEKARWECGQISDAEYCAVAVPASDTYRKGVEEEYRIGLRNYADALQSIELYYAVKASCP